MQSTIVADMNSSSLFSKSASSLQRHDLLTDYRQLILQKPGNNNACNNLLWKFVLTEFLVVFILLPLPKSLGIILVNICQQDVLRHLDT